MRTNPAWPRVVLVVWLHSSPAIIADGEWVVPATARGGRSRTHPNGYGEHELRWYDPSRVYVFDSGTAVPTDHLDRFSFTRRDYYLYEVELDGELGCDNDAGASVMQSATCARARVVRCLHRPEPLNNRDT